MHEADNNAFEKCCKGIEKGLILSKEKLLIDVEGTLIQNYLINGKKIKVVNDYYVDAVYVDSEVDLGHIISSIV